MNAHDVPLGCSCLYPTRDEAPNLYILCFFFLFFSRCVDAFFISSLLRRVYVAIRICSKIFLRSHSKPMCYGRSQRTTWTWLLCRVTRPAARMMEDTSCAFLCRRSHGPLSLSMSAEGVKSGGGHESALTPASFSLSLASLTFLFFFFRWQREWLRGTGSRRTLYVFRVSAEQNWSKGRIANVNVLC